MLSLRHFRLASWCSYPFAGGGRESGAAHLDLLGLAGGDFRFSDIPVRGDDGARAIGATDDAAAAPAALDTLSPALGAPYKALVSSGKRLREEERHYPRSQYHNCSPSEGAWKEDEPSYRQTGDQG